jgi:N-sulfoglucosamine sulfohydrolase
MRQVRRQTVLVALMAVVIGVCASTAGAAEHAARPAQRNVLLLISDDQGLDAGCYGNSVIKTPNQDKLASEGVVFTHAFATVASCSASRSVILTGLFNHTNGQFGHAHAPANLHTHANVQSVPRILRGRGYRTGIIGKYHVQPDEVYPFEYRVLTGLKGNRDVGAMAEKAREFFAAKDDRPFFLVIGYSDPHRAREDFANNGDYQGVNRIRYRPQDVRVPAYLPDQPEVREELAEYYEAVSRLDQGIGMVLKALDETGKADNTLVIYISDNGIPFPGAKTTLYDPGIHLPMIVRSPVQKKRGVVNDAMVSWLDIAPTVLDWAGATPRQEMPGRSFLPVLEQEHPQGWDTVFASHVFHEITMYYPMRVVRTRRYKLIWNLAYQLPYPFASDLWASATWQGILRRGDTMMGRRPVDAYLHRPEYELYDLESDPDEVHNLADNAAYRDVLADLKSRIRRMMETTDDPWVVMFRE